MLLHPSGFPCFGPAFAPQAKLLPSAQESLSAECQGIADDTLPGRHPHLNNRMERHPYAGLCLGGSTFKRWDRHSSLAAPCPPTASASLQTRRPTSSSSNIPKTRPHINDIRAQKVMKFVRKIRHFVRKSTPLHQICQRCLYITLPGHMSCVYCKLPDSSNIPKTRPHINDIRAQKVMKFGRKIRHFVRKSTPLHQICQRCLYITLPGHMSCVYCKLPEHQSPLHSREARFRVLGLGSIPSS